MAQTITFKAPAPIRSSSGGSGSLAAALAALNPSGVSSLGATSLPGYNGAYPYGLTSSAPTPNVQPYDFTNDPVFQQANAIVARTEAEAQAAAVARKTALAEQYGDASGLGLGHNVENIAKNNQFSVIASQKRGYNEGVTNLENQLNKANLFYSGWRGTQLGKASTQYQQNQYDARSRFQASIQDVDNQLQQALLNAEWQRLSALQGAYQSGLSNPSYYGSSSSSSASAAGTTAKPAVGQSYQTPGAGGPAAGSYYGVGPYNPTGGSPPPSTSSPSSSSGWDWRNAPPGAVSRDSNGTWRDKNGNPL